MKREGQKMRLFALKELLERETDDKHSITMDRILQLLKTKYEMDNVQAFIVEEGEAEVVTLEREGKEDFDKKDMSAYTKYTFSMYGDEPTPVTMVFQNRMVGVVMDKFGRDVVIMKEDDRHFRITVPVAVSSQFFGWVFGIGKMVRIVGPEDVKEKMKKALADIAARYED